MSSESDSGWLSIFADHAHNMIDLMHQQGPLDEETAEELHEWIDERA